MRALPRRHAGPRGRLTREEPPRAARGKRRRSQRARSALARSDDATKEAGFGPSFLRKGRDRRRACEASDTRYALRRRVERWVPWAFLLVGCPVPLPVFLAKTSPESKASFRIFRGTEDGVDLRQVGGGASTIEGWKRGPRSLPRSEASRSGALRSETSREEALSEVPPVSGQAHIRVDRLHD